MLQNFENLLSDVMTSIHSHRHDSWDNINQLFRGIIFILVTMSNDFAKIKILLDDGFCFVQ